jgi:hypothetical protein
MTNGALSNPADEVLNYLEIDISLKKRQTHLAHRGIHIGFG